MTFFTGGENKARSTEPLALHWPAGSAPCIVTSAECNKGSIRRRGTTTRTLCQSGSHSREGGTSGGRLQCAVLGVRAMSPFPYSKEAALTLVVTHRAQGQGFLPGMVTRGCPEPRVPVKCMWKSRVLPQSLALRSKNEAILEWSLLEGGLSRHCPQDA